ncbi:hypothetical protein Aca07nite_54850 [Actinoplanes capillaceus]|uniref:Uncharacterized protein n=1 Tax=Actinoplanes campanulatus TaxID=113559 RepID=A0ABQ3WPX0_9ACTN|nr:hypothetical protein Aca07nite_54850 [Actinoplanes capillaceus]
METVRRPHAAGPGRESASGSQSCRRSPQYTGGTAERRVEVDATAHRGITGRKAGDPPLIGLGVVRLTSAPQEGAVLPGRPGPGRESQPAPENGWHPRRLRNIATACLAA